MKPIYLLAISALALTACQKPPTGSTVIRSTGDVPSDLAVEYDEGTDTLTITANGTTETLDNVPLPYAERFKFYSTELGPNVVYAGFAETDSGSGFAGFGSSETSGMDFAGSLYGRDGETKVPGSGSATYTGGYSGFLVDTDNDQVVIVTGDLTLEADFDDLTVSGEIIDRRVDEGGPGGFADVTLNSTEITSSAGFSGTTSGGKIMVVTGATVGNGVYEGLFVDSDGGEVVGSVTIDHLIEGDDYVEVGAFVAED